MKAGLVGLPLTGKTTLFNAITTLHKAGDAHVHLGAIKVPDRRVDELAALYRPRKVTYAEVRFVDLPGPRGKGMDAESLRALSDVDALCLVVRGFARVDGAAAEPLPSEQPAFLESIGLREPARERFIRAAYHLLDLASFFTVGEDEVRAWTIHRGDRAPRAAGRIHSDLERGFIRAEVVHYEDFMAAGGEAKARERGRMRLEGKEYVVRDGDILHVRAAV